MWVASLLLLTGIYFWRQRVAGPRHALGCTVLLALLVPKWVAMEFGGVAIDVRLGAAILALSLYCFHPQAKIRTPLVLIDLFALALVAVHLLSDWHHEGLSLWPVLRAYGEWAAPYFAGRLTLQNLGDVRRLLPVGMAVGGVLAGLGLAEMLSGVNPFELLFGPRPIEGFPRDVARWGMKRAYGPTMHPIYFGALLVLLFPWSFYGAVRAWRRRGPQWWHAAPWVVVAGIISPLSRGPQAALLALLYAAALILAPRWRRVLVAAAVAGVALVALQPRLALEALHHWGGGERLDKGQQIVVGDQQVRFTGTMSRIYVFQVYRTAMRRAGPFGFGTEAVTGFPINVPVGPEHAETLQRVRYIDNVYILIWLRFGYVGFTCFVLLALATVVAYARMALPPDEPGSAFYAVTAGSVTGLLLLLATVWMPHDFGFLYLWTVGAAAALRAHRAWRRDPDAPRHKAHGRAAPLRPEFSDK